MTAALQQAVAGDEAAFARIVAAYHADMVRVAYGICGEQDLALDAVQAPGSSPGAAEPGVVIPGSAPDPPLRLQGGGMGRAPGVRGPFPSVGECDAHGRL